MLVRNGNKTEIKDRTVTFLLSDESKDRHNSVIKSDGWDLENYRKNPIVAYQHQTEGTPFADPNPDLIIGRGDVWQDDGKLFGSVTFEDAENNPLAEKIFKKVEAGILSAVSVGFIPIESGNGKEERGEDPGVYYFHRQELAEFSVVNVPSNPNAVKRFKEFIEKENLDIVQEKIHGPKILTDARLFNLKKS